MTQPRRADSPSPRVPPPCPTCGRILRLVSIQPDIQYINLDQRIFVCECGHSTQDFLARWDDD